MRIYKHLIDIWRPTRTVEDDGTITNSYPEATYTDVKCHCIITKGGQSPDLETSVILYDGTVIVDSSVDLRQYDKLVLKSMGDLVVYATAVVEIAAYGRIPGQFIATVKNTLSSEGLG